MPIIILQRQYENEEEDERRKGTNDALVVIPSYQLSFSDLETLDK